MNLQIRPRPERVYVKVVTAFDQTGYMCPT